MDVFSPLNGQPISTQPLGGAEALERLEIRHLRHHCHPGMITKARGDLSRRLAEITALNLTKTFFTLGGAEAIGR